MASESYVPGPQEFQDSRRARMASESITPEEIAQSEVDRLKGVIFDRAMEQNRALAELTAAHFSEDALRAEVERLQKRFDLVCEQANDANAVVKRQQREIEELQAFKANHLPRQGVPGQIRCGPGP